MTVGGRVERHGTVRSPSASARLTLDDLLTELLRQTREIVGVRDGLWRLIEAYVRVASSELSLASVLDRVVEVAREMVDAEYAALGVIGDDGGLREFVHTGFDDATVEQIGRLPEGHGILGLLITDPHVLRLDDLADHPASVGFPPRHPPMHTFLGVPIEVRGKVYGNLYFTNRRGGHGFTDDDIELVTSLAGAAGVVIDNARLHEEALRRQRWLEATRDLTGELLGGADGALVQSLIVARARNLADAVTSTLVLVDDDALLVVAADGPHATALQGQRFDRAGSLSAEALETGRAVALDDLSGIDTTTQPLAADGTHGPAMIVPLRVREQPLGTLAVARRKGQQPFTANELHAAEGFAAQAALALDYDHAQAERRRAAVFVDRERIGHDLHDLVIQRLFATGLELDSVTGRISDTVAADRIHNAVDEIDAAISDLRSSIFGLHARRRGSSTISHQLDGLCRSAAATLGFAPTCDMDPAVDAAVSDEAAPHLLAAVRETLSNVGRHARASQVAVRLDVTDEMLHLDVTDDGCGIPPTARRSGLANLAARAERLGGSMRIETGDHGTRILWHIPTR